MAVKSKILTGTALLFFSAVVIWAIRTVPDPPPLVPQEDKPKIMTYDKNTISEEKAGVKIWDMTSDSMSVNAVTQDADLTGIVGHFYNANGHTVTVTAEHGFYAHETKNIKVDGKVKLETEDGATLTADEIEWIAKEEKLAAKGNAVVIKDDMKATADVIEGTNGFTYIKAIGKAHFEKGGQVGEAKND